MPYCKRIGIFLEGDDDKRFFEKILIPFFERKYEGYIFSIIRHAEKKPQIIKNYLNTFIEDECKIFYFRDYDKGPCFKEILDKTKNRYNQLEENNIFIVRKSIEGWYLAGFNNDFLRNNNINDTDDIRKSQLKFLFPNDRYPLIMINLLEDYNIEQAIQKNASLNRLFRKMDFNV